MNIRASIEKLINIRTPGPAVHVLLLPLTLASFIYRIIISSRLLLYKWRILNRHRISCSVITVGNITVGGTGKTPTVLYLAQSLQQKGLRVVVLNRGYRGTRTGEVVVVSDGQTISASANDVGDEARMLAEKLQGVPVIAARDRVAAAAKAIELF